MSHTVDTITLPYQAYNLHHRGSSITLTLYRLLYPTGQTNGPKRVYPVASKSPTAIRTNTGTIVK